MDHDDAKCACVSRIAKLGPLSINDDLSLAGDNLAAQNAHKGGFSSTVLAEKGMNLPRPHVEIHGPKRVNAPEGLGN